MVEKRKLSTRLRAAPVWRKSSPIEEPPRPKVTLPSPPIRQPGPSVPVIVDRIDGISIEDHKLYAESGALASTLNHSKHTWLGEGIFERYWTKKYKKKGQIEVDNPPKESMSKVGLCTLAIEPHVFETTVYTVREAQQPPDTPHESSSAAQQSMLPLSTQAENGSASSKEAINVKLSDTPLKQELKSSPVPTPSTSQPLESHVTPSSTQPGAASHRKESQNQEHATATQTNQDPVIHMLAQRAVSDPSLRLLMRRVAIGDATQSELKVFQNHIEELKAQQRAKRMAQRPLAPSQTSSSPSSSSHRHSPWNGRAVAQNSVGSTPLMPQPTFAVVIPSSQTATKSSQRPPAQAQPSTAPKSSSIFKGEIVAVALEFSAGSGDRFLFPKYSILQYEAGGTRVIASFLVLRDGSTMSSGAFEPNKEYYQPVTICLSAHHPRVLEPLAKIVASQDEVRDHMNSIMDRAHRVDCNTLLMKASEAEKVDLEEDPDMVYQVSESVTTQRESNIQKQKKKRFKLAYI